MNRRGFSERPKSMGPVSKRAFTSEDVPSKPNPSGTIAPTSMRRANTNESLVGLEIQALSSTPPTDHTEWAQKQLMGMVNRSADGQRVTADEDLLESFHSRNSAFSKHGKTSPILTPEPIDSSVALGSSPLGFSQPVGPPTSTDKQPRSLVSFSSASALVGTNTLRRGTGSSVLETRMRLKREKDLQMARIIMEEENKKVRDKEKLREAEERLRAKGIRERQEQQRQERQRLQAFYENEKHSQASNSPGEDNFAYFRSMKKKIKDINVKPNLPSIGLDEKLKKFNTRVKGFLSTTNPTNFSLPIQKFRDKDKTKSSKHGDRDLPIKLNVVDDFMKDLELQRMADESRDGLSPIIPHSGFDMHSNASSSPSSDVQKKARARKRISVLKLANRDTSELQILMRSLNQELQSNNESIAAAQQTCAKIRAEMESTKTLLTRDVETTGGKVTRANVLGTQFATTVKDVKTQLETIRTATVSCSDQIKQLELHVQKVKRAKKPADTVLRYIFLALVGMGILYLVAKSRICQVLAVITAILMVIRIVKEQHSGVSGSKTPWFTIVHDGPAHQDAEPHQESPTNNSPTLDIKFPPTSSPKLSPDSSSAPVSSMRRNHSDVVLQSLLNEEQFAEVFNVSPKLGSVREEDESMGISPGRSRGVNYNSSPELPEPQITSKNSIRGSMRGNAPTGSNIRTSNGPLRTSANKDSVAMDLALRNLNQMSLKIQQMQQGK